MKKQRDFKRMVVISDLHCGHRSGITPTHWFPTTNHPKYDKLRKEMWAYYAQMMDALKPIDILVVNGDAIDGKGLRSGGTELLSPELRVQVKIAVDVINYAEADKIAIIRGTPYHTSPSGDDAEDIIADMVGAISVGDHEWFDINGTIFDFKHKVGNTSTVNKGTPLAGEQLANLLWNERKNAQPKANVIVRSHVHNYYQCGNTEYHAITTPALQGAATKFGARQCKMPVDFGFISFDIPENGEAELFVHIVPLDEVKAEAVKL